MRPYEPGIFLLEKLSTNTTSVFKISTYQSCGGKNFIVALSIHAHVCFDYVHHLCPPHLHPHPRCFSFQVHPPPSSLSFPLSLPASLFLLEGKIRGSLIDLFERSKSTSSEGRAALLPSSSPLNIVAWRTRFLPVKHHHCTLTMRRPGCGMDKICR